MTVPGGIEKLHQADVDTTLKRDVDALIKLWDDNGVLLQQGHAPVIGKSAFVEFLRQNIEQSVSLTVLKYAPEIRDIQVEGDVAYEWGYFDFDREGVGSRSAHRVPRTIFKDLEAAARRILEISAGCVGS